jgi:protein-S-isoprenylcysteine O-methyltransferase Ste14
LFTLDLTVHSDHKLVTDRFYAYVWHLAYTGSILLVAGISFSHLTSGSWLTQCGPLSVSGSALVVWVAWWSWTLAAGFSRADAEDQQMIEVV